MDEYGSDPYSRSATRAVFKAILKSIEHHDTEYEGRYNLVMMATGMAIDLGLAAGIRIDPDEPDWPVVYIELPTGQVSWHMPQHPVPFDGHSTEEKYRRIREYTDG